MSRLTMQEVIEHCEKTAKRIEDNVGYCQEWLKQESRPLESKNYLEHKQTAEWLKELQRYKDLEEDGRLIELPCKVGDTLYALWDVPTASKYVIYEAEVKEIFVSFRNCRIATTCRLEPIQYRGRRKEYSSEDFGKLVFLTKEEAEAKLKLLQPLPILHGNTAPSSKEEAMKRFGLKDKMEDLKGGAE